MTRQAYMEELGKLYAEVIRMGTVIEESLDDVENALYKMDRKLAEKIIKADDVVDKEYVDAIIPAYTAADNGKVLGVVEGKLAWGTKA